MAGLITQKYEILVNNTWTDITAYVYQRDNIQITGAEQKGSKQLHQTAQMTLTLNNRDGRFTPTYASSPYYPYLMQNVQIRMSVVGYQGYTGYRFWGVVASWPMTADLSGTDVYEQITCNGPLREINQGGGWGAALTRYYQRLTGSKVPNFYVPCEENYKSDMFASGITGTPNMVITNGTPGMGSRSTFNGSAPLPQPERSAWVGSITDTTAATSNYIRWVMYTPPYGGNNGAVLVTIATHGTISKAYIKYHAGGQLGLRLWNGSTKIADSGAFSAGLNGRNVIISVEFVQNGSNINWAIYAIYPGEKKAHASASGSVAGTVSYVTSVTADQDNNVTNTALGHFSNQRAADALHVVADSLNGNQDEMSVDRFIRVAGEQALGSLVQYDEGHDHWGFESGTQSWGANNGAVSQSSVSVSGWPTEGSHSLLLTCNGAGVPSAYGPSGTAGEPVVAGDLVSFAADVYAPAATLGSINCQLGWFNAAGTNIGYSSGTGYIMAAGDILTIFVSAVAPANTAYFNCHVNSTATETNGTLIYIDNVRVSTRMGAQLRTKYKEILHQIKDAEQGVLRESRTMYGLEFRTRITRINAPVALTLSYTNSPLTAMPAPVLDPIRLANDITVTRHRGSKINVQVSTGANSVNSPPAGVGRYAKKFKRLLAADEQLLGYANHLLTLDSNLSERYPSIQIGMHRSEVSGQVSTIAGIATGDRINITNLPFWFPESTADQIVTGYTETFTPFTWDIEWNCDPFQPWSISVSQIRRW